MKHINYLLSLFVISILLITACTPIEDNIDLENSTTIEGVKLSATNTTAGGNEIILKMETPGVTGYWDYNLGTSLSNETTIVYPIPGKSTFKFIGTLGAEFFEKTIDVIIDNIDHPIPEQWNLVASTSAEGKTWVLAKDRPANKDPFWGKPAGLYCFMSAPNDFKQVWWNAGDCCINDADAEMKFDLNGAANYTYINDGVEAKGSFVLDLKDPDNMILDLDGANLVAAVVNGQFDDTYGGKYQLKMISENELILFQKHNTGWTWVFKPKGYVYP